MSNPTQNLETPTYLLDSSTLLGILLKEPFYPEDLALPKFYQRHLEKDPVSTNPDTVSNDLRSKIDPAIVRALVTKVTIEEEIDATPLSLGLANFHLERHLLNPTLPAEQTHNSSETNGAHSPEILPHWVQGVKTSLQRFHAILTERNQNAPFRNPRNIRTFSLEPDLPELHEQRQQSLQLAKELAHHAQVTGNKVLYGQIYNGANLHQENEINTWLQNTEQRRSENELISRHEEAARHLLQTIAPEQMRSETAQQAHSQIENARRYRDRERPHRLVWEPYHLLSLLRPNTYVISTNPTCDQLIQLIKTRGINVERYGIQPAYLDNLTEITSQKYMHKSLPRIQHSTLERKIQRAPIYYPET